ncbi:flagellar assembly protein FliW [Borrelia hermsii]|uniref:Flagellar assembly factor FliW n=3 Tax=Borrelia hermsii TaxID=140 RepID=FLIW_BORHD|nr:flagellar assembly protein FliW [Borrelia hermsii]B2RZP4.1 RecName: Full=Flagellar assembly factor FliW [Borrelia hermsii DAH]AAX16700.1 transmembrane protein [Borrelia hermsii DAH]AHH12197.1 Flagellar assembly protein FliW [Borrelia hermsii YBT]AJW73002.1 flagellar assembly protein FliW [Borrelia hermsii CC1]AMR75642.1 flagellar assembly protein FliW [Borrelia hermsii]ANA42999.1 flagellar assembly protein FliW [Borrelia hermsii HS1]
MKNEFSIKFNFPDGILGFEEIKEFIIKDSEYKPFSIMQSINGEINFLVTSPFNFLEKYLPNIEEKDWLDVQAENEDEKVILCIINMHVKTYKEITANLKAPIILNKKKLIGKQAISTNEEHYLRYRVFKE